MLVSHLWIRLHRRSVGWDSQISSVGTVIRKTQDKEETTTHIPYQYCLGSGIVVTMADMAEHQHIFDDKKMSSATTTAIGDSQRPPCDRSQTSSTEVEDEEHEVGCTSACGSRKGSQSEPSSRIRTNIRKVLRAGRVEENGIRPLAVEERKEKRFFNIFTIWFSINSNILGYVGIPAMTGFFISG